jgi:hypothetical protein
MGSAALGRDRLAVNNSNVAAAGEPTAHWPTDNHGTLASSYLDFDLHVPDDLSAVPAVVLFGLRLGARMVLSGRSSAR